MYSVAYNSQRQSRYAASLEVQVQDIDKPVGSRHRKHQSGVKALQRRSMPWRKSESMEQRIEFVLKAMLKGGALELGSAKIRELYLRRHGEVASESTFKRVLERTGLTQKRRRRRSIGYYLLVSDAFDFFG